ncbi:tripartite tricarboxylate transporter substrate-binding protein [Saccharomonospora sp. NPDC046836]|uniref:Bug family tripartite tricarboxylate transporter substrate binding protein n=1 Tax=Saccharomonospora sp. NPDC046836 TaxID=3156921 RepID=UPI0034045B19
MRRAIALSAAIALAVPVAAWDATRGSAVGGPTTNLTILVPGSAGSGYDSLARETQQLLRTNGISGNVQVVNIPGASGTVGLKTLVEMSGRDNVVLTLGSAMIGGVEVTRSSTTLDDIRPIISATTDYPVFVLPENSPYSTTEEFLEAWAAAPEEHAIGGGALGNMDHISALALGQAIGIDPADVNYIAYSGGGEVLAALLSGTVAAGVSGYGEISDQLDAGRVTGIGMTAPERIDGVDLPTFAEQGIDIVMTNWRGFAAPPGISDDEHAVLVDMLEEVLTSPEWTEVVARQQWNEFVRTGDELDEFIDGEITRTGTLLEEVR